MKTCRESLPILKAHEKNDFQRFVTGDESWFILKFHHSTKWGVSQDDAPQKVKQQIETQKFMLTVICGIDGFHVVDLMTEQHSYNTQYFLNRILEPRLLAVFPGGRKQYSRRLSLHLDKCRIYRQKASEDFLVENSIIRVPHLPYSADLAPSDFWLFRDMKAALVGQKFPEPEDLLIGVQEFLSEIQRSELELAFRHWIERVQWVLDNHGDLFHE
jgi:histone-lysine N-methyltransferase SETMAR